ncbi:hypothetical protein H5410_042560 [Solanum commersonii]|uniref:Uncharacterized protein n=1 Tax=Solanum commersonii TaxID=4109 RepID=A0A9J5XYX8_SOLCO|nr:hypothetical protein H5410_042560 [Solanum commersonii]
MTRVNKYRLIVDPCYKPTITENPSYTYTILILVIETVTIMGQQMIVSMTASMAYAGACFNGVEETKKYKTRSDKNKEEIVEIGQMEETLINSILNRLDRVRRKFLWQGNKEREGYNLVEWKEVTGKELWGSGCLLCGEKAETVKHLFLHEKFTGQLWRLFLNLRGISGKVTQTFQSREEVGIHTKSKSKWRIIPASIWWTIWRERNARCFGNIENSIDQIWSNDPVSIIDVLDSL